MGVTQRRHHRSNRCSQNDRFNVQVSGATGTSERLEDAVSPMIVEVRETVVPLTSDIRNAFIDFSKMTASVVALVTDVVRDGRPVVGYGFNSNGRYAQQGLLRERFIPRLRDADPESLANESGDNFDPFRIWDVLMSDEKPGGHGERSVAVGVLDMAVWDAVAKIAGVPLFRYLANHFNDGQFDDRVWVYAAGGYYQPGKDLTALQDEMRGYLELGYETVKMKIGRDTLDQDLRRIDAVLHVVGDGSRLAVDANGRFDLETALAYAEALEPLGLRCTKRLAIHWTSNCRRCSGKRTIHRLPRARTSFRCRTPETLSGTVECDRTAMCCSSIRRCHMGLLNTCGPLRCSTTMVGRRGDVSPMVVTSLR